MDFMDYDQHPLAASLVPEMSKEEFTALRESVRTVGPLEPIVLYHQQVLDHWNLYRACQMEGKVPPFVEFCDGDPLLFIEAKHTRRNMNAAQKAWMANAVAKERAKRGVKKSEANGAAALLLHTTPKAMAQQAHVQANGTPEVKAAAMNGTLPLKHAAAQASKPKTEQKATPPKRKPAAPTMTDSLGKPVPKHLQDVFADQTPTELVRQLRVMEGKVKTLSNSNRHIRASDAVEAINIAINAINHQPYAVHASCGGSGCKMCRMSGFMTKQAHDSEKANK